MSYTTLNITLAMLAAGGWLFLAQFFDRNNRRVAERLNDLSGTSEPKNAAPTFAEFAQKTLPNLGAAMLPNDEKEKTQLKARLIHAGLYHSQAVYFFLGIKMLMTFVPIIVTVVCYLLVPGRNTTILFIGTFTAIFGMLAPGLWLDSRTKKRRTALRRALPDALDLEVICLEGGISLSGALQRVGDALASIHPLLDSEMKIVNRAIQLGMQPAAALGEFAERSGLDELRRLAAVVGEAERLGGSMAQSLRTHAESLREQRTQKAEETAHKSAVKVMIPTVLCIFPMIVLIMGVPIAVRFMETMAR